ncbi:succinylglutamate desuccinylase/aspartoacylase family protein [Pseudoruegeria sp. SK021]|uniref:succinylglutamate desuccinylase/aspartoacylase family protein n=1 Tax=Pseudoruegeria sp. SK021 TaxID=1933035 RepID=UPI000A237A44|nr:succinylglutamate desuccinylase/aspartoacylase family protein [Pseudoruegeria sp. SK021]OSP54678.1 succinylglutamate desuccinylase [Pseudoruegeria sp. SK021]
MQDRAPFQIGTKRVAPGARRTVELPVSVLSDHTPVSISVHVVHGRRPGPTMFVSAAVHGDEVIGVEIARRLMRAPSLDNLKGTLLIAPIVNTFGFLNHSRYLPDRRDLNRSFPGSPKGSLAARLARLFMVEIVARSDFGIDLHSAAIHRTNLPQIRVSPSKPETMELAEAFGAPVILTAPLREGSMRQAAQKEGVDMLLFEAGEGLRFDEFAVRSGVSGILRVMRKLDMVPAKGIARPTSAPIKATSSSWMRAPAGGLVRMYKTTGEAVHQGDLLGVVSDPFGEVESDLVATESGLIIGRSNLPIVNEGDGLFHIATVSRPDQNEETIGDMATQLSADPLFDEDEII